MQDDHVLGRHSVAIEEFLLGQRWMNIPSPPLIVIGNLLHDSC